MHSIRLWALFAALALASDPAHSETLPGTGRLEPQSDFSATMVAGIDKMALRLIDQSRINRQPTREKLRAALGMIDERLPVRALEMAGDTTTPALLFETPQCRVFRVRWPVFDGVQGEGIYIQPKAPPHARVIILPDADEAPELAVDQQWLAANCEVVIMALVSRGTRFSKTDRLGIQTNIPHREWIHRQSFQLGRHLIGYELQKAFGLVDWFKAQPAPKPLIVAGRGEGGMLALLAGAMDQRIDGVLSSGHFAPREQVWREPLERNVFGLLKDLGDAELASLVAPRPLVLRYADYPSYSVAMMGQSGQRAVAAPGQLSAPDRAAFDAEVARARSRSPECRLLAIGPDAPLDAVVRHLLPASVSESVLTAMQTPVARPKLAIDADREERTVRQLERFTQQLLVACEAERSTRFWRGLPLKPLSAFEARTEQDRDRFWNEVIGRLPDPNLPMNAKSRFVRETAKVAIYEVTLDVWTDVFAWGWLCLPKNLEPGERRPVVVCQHGLEGLPTDTVDSDPTSSAWRSYKGFALRLAEEGFITFAPHNPYRGEHAFRTLQRKLNPLGLTLYSVINGQHQRILEWLKSQPFANPEKIAFYGLSYGGKSAMRTPAVLKDYCLSICSGDFNEWVRYCVSTDLPIPSYVHTIEYEIWEWNLARTFNYAEMAALIAPRPFMVERGHDDGCGTDEMVNYEYAKVRRLYDKLGVGDRTTIEHFDGPHTIHGVGTFDFLRRHLMKPPTR
jgi:cephalosporin-C deacetylase-like acetyl esterase